MGQQVVVEISPEGEVSVRVEGTQGPSCVPLARHIAGMLGQTASEEHTDEFWLCASPGIVALGLREGWISSEEAKALLDDEEPEEGQQGGAQAGREKANG